MARGTEIKCDVCKIVKQETNHWLACAVVSPTSEEPGGGIAFAGADARLDDDDDPEMKFEDICGEACAHKRLSQWLTDYKLQSTKESGQ